MSSYPQPLASGEVLASLSGADELGGASLQPGFDPGHGEFPVLSLPVCAVHALGRCGACVALLCFWPFEF